MEYLVESSVWSLGGLVIGFILGRLERDVWYIRKRLEKDDDAS